MRTTDKRRLQQTSEMNIVDEHCLATQQRRILYAFYAFPDHSDISGLFRKNLAQPRRLPHNGLSHIQILEHKMNIITLEQADTIIDAIFEKSRELNLRPMSAVVVEPGNVVKAFKKEDHASALRLEMALGKTYAALALGRSSSLVQVRAEERPNFMKFIDDASDRRVFAEGGGMLIRSQHGDVIGAVGVTGDRQNVDEDMAAHGIHVAGLKTDGDCKDLEQLVRLDN
jgi:uncharacterized protein GlcG (DUF336 family)